MSFRTLSVSMLMALAVGSAASAATVTFNEFASTNVEGQALSPVVTVSENGRLFDVTVSNTGSFTGNLNLIAFDLAGSVSSFDVSSFVGSTSLTLQSGTCDLNGNNGEGTFWTGSSVPLGSEGNNLNGLSEFTADAVLAFQNKDEIARTGTFKFTVNLGSSVTLADCQQVGLRFKSATNAPESGGSDKLLGSPSLGGTTPVVVPAVPLPAADLLLVGAIGGLGAVARRKARAA